MEDTGREVPGDIDQEEFRTEFVNKGIPAVLRGLASNWPATKWTPEGLSSRVGDTEFWVRKKETEASYKVGTEYKIVKMKFSDYIKRLLSGSKTASKYYLAVQNLKRLYPELLKDLEIPSFIGNLHGGPFLWIAHEGHYEYCHVDPDDGLLVQLHGSKTIKLYSYEKFHAMYPNKMGSKGRTIQSQVDCDNPDIKKFPLFKDMAPEVHHLEPGDALFIPAFYWHQVTSDTTAISVNMFFGSSGKGNFVKHLLDTRCESLVYWLLNVIEQNKTYPSWNQTLLPNLESAISQFFRRQYKEEITKEQEAYFVKRVLSHCNLEKVPRDPEAPERRNPPHLKIRGLLWRK